MYNKFPDVLISTKFSDYVKVLHQLHGDEIKQVANRSFLSLNTNLSHLCLNSNELLMSHSNDKLLFIFTDNSKPFYYKEYLDGVIVDKKFDEKYRKISYDYPYIETVSPTRLVEDMCGIFRTGNYTLIKSSKSREPNYGEVEKLIYKILEIFNK